MHLQHQALVDRMVQQHQDDFAALHADLAEAVPEVAERWVDRYENPADMHGQNRCTSVRQTLFSIFAGRDPEPFSRLTAKEGPGMSVVLLDDAGHRIRVRRWPTDHFKERIRPVETPPPGQHEAVMVAQQMMLDEGLEVQVLPRAVHETGVELFVLWWANTAESDLAGASLAVVADIDSSSLVRILATVPLPPPARSTSGSVKTMPQATMEPLADFEEFDRESSGEGGTAPA